MSLLFSWTSMFFWYHTSKAVHWMCSDLVFLRWTRKTVCHHWWGFSMCSSMGFDHLQGFLCVWLACSRVHMRSISVSVQWPCLFCSVIPVTWPYCSDGLMCAGAPATVSCSAMKVLAYAGFVITLLSVWHSSLHRYWLHLFPMNSEVLLAVTRKQIEQSNSTISETYSWEIPS